MRTLDSASDKNAVLYGSLSRSHQGFEGELL
jgi:hypothetical protein